MGYQAALVLFDYRVNAILVLKMNLHVLSWTS